jgi:peroxiredoxin Q/BCP
VTEKTAVASAPAVAAEAQVWRGGVKDPQVGDEAPLFELPSNKNRRIGLWEFRGRAQVLLLFYPGDETLICTRQMCSYAAAYQAFEARGYQILGISPDSVESHKDFARNRKIPFPLLADTHGDVATWYGVQGRLIHRPKRAVFLIDKAGIVRFRHLEPTRLLYKKADAVLELIERATAA